MRGSTCRDRLSREPFLQNRYGLGVQAAIARCDNAPAGVRSFIFPGRNDTAGSLDNRD